MQLETTEEPRPHRRRGLIAATIVALAVLLAATPAARATQFEGGQNYSLAAGQTISGNLYASGDTVNIDGTVEGDLIMTAGTAIVGPTAVIQGDVMAAGREVRIRGTVEGDVRSAGYLVQAEESATIGGEMISAGFSVGVLDQASVGGMFVGFGFQGLIDGSIAGDARFAGSALEVNGSIAGDLRAEVDASDQGGGPPPMFMPNMPPLPRSARPGLSLAEGAVGGDLSVAAPGDISVDASAVAGSIEKRLREVADEIEEQESRPPAVAWLLEWLKTSAALLVFGALAVWIAPRALDGSQGNIRERALPSTGWGCLTLLVVPTGIAALVIATFALLGLFGAVQLGGLASPILSFSGLLLALLTAGVNLLAWLARVAVAVWVGGWILGKVGGGMAGNRWAALVLGVLIYALLRHLPYVGWWLHVFWSALGLGALILFSRPWWPRRGGGTTYSEPVLDPTKDAISA